MLTFSELPYFCHYINNQKKSMKNDRGLGLILLVILLLPISFVRGARFDSVVPITLTASTVAIGEDDIDDLDPIRDNGDRPMTRGLLMPVFAGISQNYLLISFKSGFKNVVVRIVKEDTDEIVYDEQRSFLTEWNINLVDFGRGDFTLAIIVGNTIYEGYFSL